MKKTRFLFDAILFFVFLATFRPEVGYAAPQMVRIGVDIQQGLQACMDTWLPVAEHLSKEIPDHRFVIVPLASQQDVIRSIEKGDVDFLVLDPAMEIMANDRYGAIPLATVLETDPNESKPPLAEASCSGTIIRRADRTDLDAIKDIRGKRLSAVKPWSLTGWLAQWGFLEKKGIHVSKDLEQVVFEGTNRRVIDSVLDGSSDMGAVDTDVFLHMIRGKQAPEDSLYYINHEGRAVPLATGENISSTEAFPGRVLSKTEATSNELAQRVEDALMRQDIKITVDNVPYQIRWTTACNYGKVRRLLRTLMGPDYAESAGYPLPIHYPAWVFHAAFIIVVLVVFMLAFLVLRSGYAKRESRLKGQLEDLRRELLEARAERQRIDTILALAGCGIDIVDENNRIVYADSGLERDYGDWRGRKCHQYYCSSETPCPGCRRPDPNEGSCQTVLDIDGSELPPVDDPHAKVHYINGESTRMIGIPFRDEGGRWLYARIHFPLAAFAAKNDSWQ